jgi:hypothetical protein
MSKKITVVLNGYKRNYSLKEQVEAIKKQTVEVDEIFYWQNTAPDVDYDEDTYNELNSALSNYNYGVWARFAFALNARTDYVCVLDDDTIPGNRWLENCLNTYETNPGLLGGIGLRFKNDRYEIDNLPDGRLHRYGWDNTPQVAGNNTTPVQVDIVGHSWFFSRDLLSVFWRELPDSKLWSMLCGEDIHFSYMLQKYTDMKTWVPPHPPDDTSMWSSLKGMLYGTDKNAIYYVNRKTGEMDDYLKYCLNKGFKLYKDLND